MEVTRVAITEMPSMGWMEFLLQWGGLFTQAAAAAGTLLAVFIALHLARADRAREDTRREDKTKFVLRALTPELRRLRSRSSSLLILLDAGANKATRDMEARRPFGPSPALISHCKQALDGLATPMLSGVRDHLIELRSDVALDAVTVETRLPQVIEWLQRIADAPTPWFDPMLPGLAAVSAEVIAECGACMDRLLSKAGEPSDGAYFTRYVETGSLAP